MDSFLKSQKVDKGDGTCHYIRKVCQTLFFNSEMIGHTEKRGSRSKTSFYAESDSINNSYQWKSPLRLCTEKRFYNMLLFIYAL